MAAASSVKARPGSPFLHFWNPDTRTMQNTKIPIGVTATEQKANQALAEAIRSKVMNARALRAAGLPVPDDPDAAATATTFRTYAVRYEADVVPRHRGAYRERQILPRLVAAFGDLRLSEKASRWVEAVKAWRTVRLATPTKVKHYGGKRGTAHTFSRPSPNTVNREVGLLRQMLRAAVADQLIDVSPLTRFGALEGPPIRRRLATPDEETKILAQLDPARRAVYILATDGLVRLGDCLDVKRSERHGLELDIRYPKNGEPLTIRVSSRLAAALDAVPVDPKHPDWYFPQLRQASEQNRARSFAKALQRACEAADVPYGKKNRGITFHWATRMTGATRMIRNGGDGAVKDVAQLGGWKTLDVLLQIYQQTTTDDLARLVELANPAASLPAPTPPPATRQARRAASRLRQVK